MNGRCENDPLDRAVDVCDSCYGEFCRYCLVFPKGRRHPVCRDCALVLSGVRGTASPPARGERRTVKQRRTELQAAAAEEDTRRFRFFDDQGNEAAAEAEDAKGRRRRPKRKPKTGADDEGTDAGPITVAADATRPDEAGTDAAIGPDPDDEPAGTAFDPLPAARSATPAVARLEELRRRRLAGELPDEPDEPEEDTEPEGDPEPEVEVLHPRTAELAAQLRTTYATPVTDRRNGSERRKPGRPVAGARTDRRQRPERRTDTAAGAGTPEEPMPATAPMIGEVRVIGGRRAADDPRAAASTATVAPPQPAAAPAPTRAPAPTHRAPAATVEPPPAPAEATTQPAVEAAPQPRPGDPAGPTRGRVDTPGKADTDAEGNWIPPILRGMAADAREASTSLPQRRRQPNE